MSDGPKVIGALFKNALKPCQGCKDHAKIEGARRRWQCLQIEGWQNGEEHTKSWVRTDAAMESSPWPLLRHRMDCDEIEGGRCKAGSAELAGGRFTVTWARIGPVGDDDDDKPEAQPASKKGAEQGGS